MKQKKHLITQIQLKLLMALSTYVLSPSVHWMHSAATPLVLGLKSWKQTWQKNLVLRLRAPTLWVFLILLNLMDGLDRTIRTLQVSSQASSQERNRH